MKERRSFKKVCLGLIVVVPVILAGCNNSPKTVTSSEAKASDVKPGSGTAELSEYCLPSEDAPNYPEPIIIVSPTYELAWLIERYEKDIVRDAEYERGSADFREKLLELKRNGRTRWRSEEWMKEPEYYEGLNTFALVEDCFSKPIFFFEMGLYIEPAGGFEHLRVFHNGFAELFKRDDMWKGILHLYEFLPAQLDPEAPLKQIINASTHLDMLSLLYGLAPLREQVKGKEKIFLAAHLRVLKKFQWYIEKKRGTDGPLGFFRQPCSVARVALMLAKQVDPQRYAEIEPAITSVRWTQEQKVEDLESFLDLVFESLKGFVTEHDIERLDGILSEEG